MKYLDNVLNSCSAPNIKKSKRKMSGYNCFIKTIVDQGDDFRNVIESKVWSQIPNEKKKHWNNLANQGCPKLPK